MRSAVDDRFTYYRRQHRMLRVVEVVPGDGVLLQWKGEPPVYRTRVEWEDLRHRQALDWIGTGSPDVPLAFREPWEQVESLSARRE